MPTTLDITDLLNAGQTETMQRLFPIVYRELRQIAHRQLRSAWDIDTICTTALVNEAYIKLVGHDDARPTNRAHFFAIAATAMRQILINYAAQKKTKKRGGDWQRVSGAEMLTQPEHRIATLLAVDNALEEINAIDEDLARLVELRFFAGMTEVEIASVLGVNERTVRRNWKKAKALLAQAMAE